MRPIAFLLCTIVFAPGQLLAQNTLQDTLQELNKTANFAADEAVSGKHSAQIVAEVESRRISKQELEAKTAEVFGLDSTNFSPEHRHFLQKQVLTQMVDTELLLLAARDHFTSQVSESPEAAATQRPNAEQLIDRYFSDVVFANLHISKEAQKTFYETHKGEFLDPLELQVRELVLLKNDTVDPASLRAVLEKLRREVIATPSIFAKRARQYSQVRSAARGGLRGFMTAEQLGEEFREVLLTLPDSEVSEIFETEIGFHIIRIEQRRGGIIRSFEAVQKRIAGLLLDEARTERYHEHLRDLKNRYKVIVYYN